MTDKKDKTKRKTKAGMLENAASRNKSERDKSESKKDTSENLPQISKEKAEERTDERPLH